jgi:hypothetical protein
MVRLYRTLGSYHQVGHTTSSDVDGSSDWGTGAVIWHPRVDAASAFAPHRPLPVQVTNRLQSPS